MFEAVMTYPMVPLFLLMIGAVLFIWLADMGE